MIKKLLSILLFIVLMVGLMSCASKYITGEYGSAATEGTQATDVTSDMLNYALYSSSVVLAEVTETAPERKIVYTADIAFNVTDLEKASSFLESLLEPDEWFDSATITPTLDTYVVRIKTDRLDAFLDALKDEYSLRSFSKVGTDVSLDYQDTSNKMISLQAQLDRLLELYPDATLAEMIVINEKIADIEVKLATLQGTLNKYDSLVDYSKVTLKFYGSTITTNSPFFNRLGGAFTNGFNGLVSFFDSLLIGIATIIPFVVVFGGIGVGAIIVYKKKKKDKMKKAKNPEEPK
ncbi:MAG: DUF4349 domain-containing protein [Candidatus Izemoplasmatales bacterium]|nr:DUF4349 domain-containing protein [Candidatus Izemoplasmatales bacterium]